MGRRDEGMLQILGGERGALERRRGGPERPPGHAALRQVAVVGGRLRKQGRPPAQAAGLTDHRWAVQKFLLYQVPPPPWVPPRRERLSKRQEAGVAA
jgi:hypothetical protein